MSNGWIDTQVGNFRLKVDWHTDPGEVLVLFGQSGAGKTLMLRIIAGLIKPINGKITIGDKEVFDHKTGLNLPSHLRNVGYVPQDLLVFPHLNVFSNISYGIKKDKGVRDKVMLLLSQLELNGLENRYEWELSGGEKQRVALARALAPDPEVLLLDEPFSALDLDSRRRTRNYVRQILEGLGIPVILVTHDREEAVSMGNKIAIINKGELVDTGDPISLIGYPSRETVANLVGVENILNLEVQEIFQDQGIMLCSSGGFSIEIPSTEVFLGQNIKVGLRADDVILASEKPTGLSARNVKHGVIRAIYFEGGMYKVEIDCGQTIISHVTKRAVEELALKVDGNVWIVIKSASCFVLHN